MPAVDVHDEPTTLRRIFPAWSIDVPRSFAETFVANGDYWHGYDEHRSISLSSVVITENGRPVTAQAIARRLMPALAGKAVDDVPEGLLGRAVTVRTRKPAIASRALSGVVAVDGRVLIATITSDDPVWARRIWSSIRTHRASLPR